MSATSQRVRAELRAETGVDFNRYRDDDLMDAVSGWSGVLGLVGDGLMALGVGVVVILVTGSVGLVVTSAPEARIGMIVASVVAGTGVGVIVFSVRARGRLPAEADKVFALTSAMADRVAVDVAGGRLSVTAAQAARGLAIVAAVPALTRVAQRRFPLIGTLMAPLVGSILARGLARVWPDSRDGDALVGLEGTARRLDQAIGSARSAVVPKLATAVRWVTLPLIVGGCVLLTIAFLVGVLSVISA